MLKNSNIDDIKEIAKKLFDVVDITPNEKFPFVCCHPYTSTTILYSKKGEFCDLMKKEDFGKWRENVFRRLDNCKTVSDFLLVLNKPWYMAFLKYAKNKMSLKDFSYALGEAWVMQENPNGDINVPIRTSLSWFKQADKKALMGKEDYEKWCSLDAGLVVYRGVVVRGNPKGLSWTTSKEQAIWFAHRYDISSTNETGYLQRLVISNKDNILAYFSTADEEEVVVDTYAEKGIEIMEE